MSGTPLVKSVGFGTHRSVNGTKWDYEMTGQWTCTKPANWYMLWKEWPFGRSAGACYPQVPSERQVKTLEAVLGNRLLNRDSRHVTLTEAGEAYYRHARIALDRMVAAEAAARTD